MPDISMCCNKTCPMRMSCYRFRAIPSRIQGFCEFQNDGDKCDYFMQIAPTDRVRPLEEEEDGLNVSRPTRNIDMD